MLDLNAAAATKAPRVTAATSQAGWMRGARGVGVVTGSGSHIALWVGERVQVGEPRWLSLSQPVRLAERVEAPAG